MYKRFLLMSVFSSVLSFNAAFAGLTEEIEDVKEYARSHPQLSLALGVSDKETSLHIKFADEGWIFLNDTQSGDLKGRHLEVNFNNQDELKQLAEELPEVFCKIVLDHNVYKFTNWKIQHLEYLKKTLKSKGTLQFEPDYTTATDETLDQNHLMERLRSKLDDTKLEKSFMIPEEFPIIEGEFKDEIDKEVEKRKQNSEQVKEYAISMDLIPFSQRCLELGIKSEDIAPHHILKDPAKLGRYYSSLELRLTKEITKRHFCEKFFEEVLLPHNEMVLKKVFHTVEFKRKVEYPIPTSTGAPRIIDYFICTK
ncbi:MAG: hypothetical protein BGO67_00975 [Alphaproteobacteria bacterium 41-28]|nr:MAG: hypothetical protein BGO67_00975 [Alphaproteobacteria bacterium 41-28]